MVGAVYCKDGEAPVVSNKVELVNVKWERQAEFPHYIVPTSGTYRFGGKELNIQAVAGISLYNVKGEGFIAKGLGGFTLPFDWPMALGRWKEKNSGKFAHSWCMYETYQFTMDDVEELEKLYGDK